MADLDERALIERCRSGDDIAFGELVERYKNLVYGMVWRMVTDRSQTDDLDQEVFLKVHRGLPYFRGDARLSTWIFRIMANVCSEARGRRMAEVPGRRASLDCPMAPCAALERRDRLDKAMAPLPDQYRMLIAAHYLEGVQYEALAEALDMPVGREDAPLSRQAAPARAAVMNGHELAGVVEPIAAGDIELDDAMRGHLESCPICAAALASARRLEAALAADVPPPIPARFTALVRQRVRHGR